MLTSSYFGVGTVVLYGKYKNHRGVIVGFGQDKWGNPTVEIEPIPKGRKQNKVLGLFRIWRADVREKALAEKKEAMDALADRVASRFVLAAGIPLGKTWERDNVRVHRYADLFLVTDLTNAGKRGKKVRQMSIALTHAYKGDRKQWMEHMSAEFVGYANYDRIKAFIGDILHDHPGEIRINETEVRGVDVNPGGFEKIEFDVVDRDWSLSVVAELDDFLVVHRHRLRGPTRPDEPANDDGTMFQDTTYYPSNKAGAKVFYNWLRANLNNAKGMTIDDFRKLWRELKIPYDSH